MTLSPADERYISAQEARELTDRIKESVTETVRLAFSLPTDKRRSARWVYFIQCGPYDDDPIKIGVADDVPARLAQLQTASPWPLRLLGFIRGDFDEEGALHDRFRHLHVRGEWFEGAPELLAFIARVTR